MITLPTPLTPEDCDLRDFPFMPLDVVRLRDSDIASISSGDEFRCAVLLWCVSWHQVPSGSLPDDDVLLSQYAGFGRVVKEWKKVRDGALRGWIKCSDGRLYHPVVAEKANEAWAGRVKYREKKEAERIAKAERRAREKAAADELAKTNQANLSAGQTESVRRTDLECPPDKPPLSANCPAENALIGTVDSGQWTVDRDSGQLTSKPDTSSQTSTVETGNGHPGETIPARNVQIAILLRDHQIDATSQNPIVCLTWASNPRVTDEVLMLAIAKAKRAKPKQRIPVAYLAPIVEQELNQTPANSTPNGYPTRREEARAAAAATIGLGAPSHDERNTIDGEARIIEG